MKVATAITIVTLLATSIPAQAQTLGAYSDAQGLDSAIEVAAPGVVMVYFFARGGTNYTSVSFRAPIPPCFEGASFLAETSPFSVVAGNSQSGITISFGACTPIPVPVLTVYLNVSTPTINTTCCPYDVLDVEFTDCSVSTVNGTGIPGLVGGWQPPMISDRLPPNGATSQPLDTKLAWAATPCSQGLGVMWYNVYFGTATNPPVVAQYLPESMYDPGVLTAGMTYYWKLVAVDTDAGSTTTDEWSFTTETPLPVETSTWGRVKALFGGAD